MPSAEEILRQQQVTKDSTQLAEKNLVEREAELKLQALNAGYDSVDPIGAFHKAVKDFNEKVVQFNLNVKAFSEDRERFQSEATATREKLKVIEDAIAGKQRELTAKTMELENAQKAVSVLSNQYAEKLTEVEKLEEKTKLLIATYRKILVQIQERADYHYNLAMDDKLGKLKAWGIKLFRGY